MTTEASGHQTRDLLPVLHRHWLYASSVDHHLRRSQKYVWEDPTGMPEGLRQMAKAISFFSVLSVWYALLWVVVEGYREVGIPNEDVDALLARQEMVERLRRFRNAVFHFQKDPFDPKLMEFLEASESEKWIKDLNNAFERYFEQELGIAAMVAELKKE